MLENPNNSLEQPANSTSFSQFELPAFLHEGLERLGFEIPTEVQAQSIPALLAGQDLVAQSHTGSGKTAAFAIPLITRVQRQSRDLQALIMVPTRELALQITQVFKSLAGPAVRITTIYGGAGMEGQVRGLTKGGYQIVIGTPGRLRDHLNRGTLRLDKLRMLILDEADEMLDRGFAPDVEAIIKAAPEASRRQTALFSATLPEWVMDTARRHLRPNHVSITLEPSDQNRPEIDHVVYDMKPADKPFALKHLLDTHHDKPILVFARTKHGVKKLAARLESDGYKAAGLQGNLSQRAREEVMAAFRNNRIRIMVATNVGARGLDVSGISHVINFDLPESAELFTHRVGRTGRNGANGTAITFLTGEDRPKWREIQRAMEDRGIDYSRSHWDGPRAVPGGEPAFSAVQVEEDSYARQYSRPSYDTRSGRSDRSQYGVQNDRRQQYGAQPERRGDYQNAPMPERQEAGRFDNGAERNGNSRYDGSFAPRRDNRFTGSPERNGNTGYGERQDRGRKPTFNQFDKPAGARPHFEGDRQPSERNAAPRRSPDSSYESESSRLRKPRPFGR